MKWGYKTYFRILKNIIILGAIVFGTWGAIFFVHVINQFREFNIERSEFIPSPSYIFFSSKVDEVAQSKETIVQKPLTFFTDFDWNYVCISNFRYTDNFDTKLIGTRLAFYILEKESNTHHFRCLKRFGSKLENKIPNDQELCFNKNVILQFNKEKNTILILESTSQSN